MGHTGLGAQTFLCFPNQLTELPALNAIVGGKAVLSQGPTDSHGPLVPDVLAGEPNPRQPRAALSSHQRPSQIGPNHSPMCIPEASEGASLQTISKALCGRQSTATPAKASPPGFLAQGTRAAPQFAGGCQVRGSRGAWAGCSQSPSELTLSFEGG